MKLTTLTIARLIGGSRLYGLETPESDIDERFIFINTSPAHIIGLDRHEYQVNQDEDVTKEKSERKDEQGWELRHFLRLLRAGNTQALEFLHAPEESFTLLRTEFKMVRQTKANLVSSKAVYNSMRGYAANEFRLALGERTGRLGSKRKQALETYGYSPSNFVHLIRLAYTAITFFETGEYIVGLKNCNEVRQLLLDIKQNPAKYSKEALSNLATQYMNGLDAAFASRKTTLAFNEEVANRLCVDVYLPRLLMVCR